MWNAVIRGALCTLPVLALGLWSQLWLQRTLEAEAEAHGKAVARQAADGVDTARAALSGELARLCRFDRRVDRLRAELQAPSPRADARRSLTAITSTLSLTSAEVRPAAGDDVLARSARSDPAPAPAAADGATLPLTAQCALSARLTLHARRDHRVSANGEGAPRWTVAPDPPAAGRWLRAWPELDGDQAARLWLRIDPPQRPVAAIQAATAVAVVLAFGLGLWLLRSRGALPDAESTALTAIERAADRVARGDLASHIGVTTGTPADRTLNAFNRMTEELRATREKLMKAERAAAWQDMARRIAHEIKNPLSPIRTAMETLRKAHARGLEEFDEIFEESSLAILEEVDRLQHIVREFSDFARLPKLVPGAIDLRDTVEHAVSVARHEGVPIDVDAPAGLPAARADREQLTQVLLNLLQNACAAASEQRGDGARVELRLRRAERGIAVEVHDNGPGVPADARAQIFQPYFTQRKGGSGLGLTIAARMVEEHGGLLRVTDSPLGGALFHFELPLEGDAGQTTRQSPPLTP